MERMSSRFCASRLGADTKVSQQPIAASRESFMQNSLKTGTTKKGTTGGRPPFHLLRGRQMRAAIALVTGIAGVGTYRAILTVADGADLIGGYAQLHQEVLGSGGAAVTQTQVVFGRAALIAVP